MAVMRNEGVRYAIDSIIMIIAMNFFLYFLQKKVLVLVKYVYLMSDMYIYLPWV